MTVGDVVIVKDDNLPRNRWQLARMVHPYASDDGLVRRVNVIASAIANRFLSLKVTALQFVGNIARVSFADTASKELIMRMESVYVGDIACLVRSVPPKSIYSQLSVRGKFGLVVSCIKTFR